MSGKKLASLRTRALDEIVETSSETFMKLNEFYKDEAKDFSMAVHPSYQAGVMSVMQALMEGDRTSGGASHYTEWASTRTFHYATVSCLMMISYLVRNLARNEQYNHEILGGLTDSETKILVRILEQGAAVTSVILSKGMDSSAVREAIAALEARERNDGDSLA